MAVAELENELAGNREMQRALDELTRDAVEQSQADLMAAAERQQQLAEELDQIIILPNLNNGDAASDTVSVDGAGTTSEPSFPHCHGAGPSPNGSF